MIIRKKRHNSDWNNTGNVMICSINCHAIFHAEFNSGLLCEVVYSSYLICFMFSLILDNIMYYILCIIYSSCAVYSMVRSSVATGYYYIVHGQCVPC